MIPTTAKIGKAILLTLAVFVFSAVVEAFITVWVFRKYGGCPIANEIKAKKQLGGSTMNTQMVNRVYGSHTPFEMEQLMKKKPVWLANVFIQLFGSDAEHKALEIIHDCLEKERFIPKIREQHDKLELRRHNRGRW